MRGASAISGRVQAYRGRAAQLRPPMLPRGKAPAKFDHDMPVTGLVPGMAIHVAGCCHPCRG